MMTRFFDCFQLAAVACLACLGIGRALAMYARGVGVLVIDRERSLARALGDLLSVILILVWAYEIVAYAWPLRTHLVPPSLGIVVVDAVAIKVMGTAVALAGLVIYALALRAFGDSWRLGIDRDAPGALVTDGVFAWTRNPIYVGLDLLAIGTSLVQGRPIVLALALVIVVMLHDQILREERFLARAYGNAYREYCARVRRYGRWR
jgi:protein-S-isoprenylcysteine O-methyltransferase Ste14